MPRSPWVRQHCAALCCFLWLSHIQQAPTFPALHDTPEYRIVSWERVSSHEFKGCYKVSSSWVYALTTDLSRLKTSPP
ncbi:hypothetical protein BU16DRAFT_80314 [Lophium mytilinum]|uniref:Secreted protein n=1 Tax=Lophium mytilinum TaxID=390894 RepID=A0A6A6QMZ2_9PEZI|nr:hypothetical protein BU16DRAFT_80314 [Lophium mytilinum]